MQIRKMAFHNAIALFFHEPSSANVEPSRLKFPVGPFRERRGTSFYYSHRRVPARRGANTQVGVICRLIFCAREPRDVDHVAV